MTNASTMADAKRRVSTPSNTKCVTKSNETYYWKDAFLRRYKTLSNYESRGVWILLFPTRRDPTMYIQEVLQIGPRLLIT